MAIYTKFGKQRTIKQFITLLFSNIHIQEYKGVETYFDPECNKVQCKSNKYRSFDDVLECVNTYYKNITPKKLMSILCKMHINNNYFYTMYCGDIQKPVMLFYNNGQYNNSIKKYNSKYSWNELYNMINIHSQADLINYRNNEKI